MANSSDVRRRSRLRCAGLLSVIICLGAGSGGSRAQEPLAANAAISQKAGALPARIHAQGPKACGAAQAKVDYLTEELVTQRFESARLSIELAETKAEGDEIKQVARQQEALLTALTAVVATRERQDVIVRSEAVDLRQRLEAAQAELRRERLENDRLAAELAVAHKAAESATMLALENLAVINTQIAAFHGAVRNSTVEQANQPAGLLSALWLDLPAAPRQKSPLEPTR